MDLIFNELSATPASDLHSGQMMIKNLLLTCKKAKEFGISKLAVSPDFYTKTFIYDDFNIGSWLNDSSTNFTLKNLLQSVVRYPYIKNEDSNIEDDFIVSNFYLDKENLISCEGLGVAWLYNTISASFNSDEQWNKSEVKFFISRGDNYNKLIITKHVSQPEHLDNHKRWIEESSEIILVESDIKVENKTIKLRDDHGKDKLLKFCKRIAKSPYVKEIINSLPFNSYETKFVKDVYDDGIIELVLIDTDKGLGLVVQTTGRNISETKKIAEILEKQFN